MVGPASYQDIRLDISICLQFKLLDSGVENSLSTTSSTKMGLSYIWLKYLSEREV